VAEEFASTHFTSWAILLSTGDPSGSKWVFFPPYWIGKIIQPLYFSYLYFGFAVSGVFVGGWCYWSYR
jgi:hypothetical protein